MRPTLLSTLAGLASLGASLVLLFAQSGCLRCAAQPGCGSGYDQVPSCSANEPDCMLVSVCGTTVYCKAVNNCEAYPTCDAGDVEVEECPPGLECYETSICGATITCAPGGTCGAVPTCDPGDMEITGACPSGVSCYELTLCDTTITCRDDAAPAHGCPLAEPTTGGACDPATAPAECEYPPCGFYGCVETNGVFEWTATGGCG